jgi:pimeloyl-ACP methyl ester carboxylesterase
MPKIKSHYPRFCTVRAELKLAYLLYQSRQLGYWPPIDVVNEHTNTLIFDKIRNFITSKHFREVAKVGSTTFRGKGYVLWNFKDDFLNSVRHHLSLVLEHYQVLLYAGQFDMLIPPTQIERVITSLNWTDSGYFLNARRDVWYVNDVLAGYSKEYGNLKHVIVRKSGHFILRTQPVWIRDLFTNFARAHRIS